MTAILGISAFYHDSAAALLVDGEIVAAAQEERFTRIKHDQGFPVNSIEYCLREAGIEACELDFVGFYDKPLLKFARLVETYAACAPTGLSHFLRAMPVWLKHKLHVPRELSIGLGKAYRRRYIFTEHHESHAASAFFPSPFKEAAILTLDGVGEWATASISTGRGNKINLLYELQFPHSLGLLYSAFTYYCGFEVNSGEYKLMGLAPYGEPRFEAAIRNHLIDLKDDGSFRMDMSYFNYAQGLTMTSERFHRLFGGPPRASGCPVEKRHMDIASSMQRVCEEIMLRCAKHARRVTAMKNLCLAGGVALNCVGNRRILRETDFDEVWVQPAAGDAGGALGVALFIWHQLLDRERRPIPEDGQKASLLGPAYSDEEVEQFLESVDADYYRFDDDESLCEHVSAAIAAGDVVAWFQGRMEFGPRALGSRSILADPRRSDMQSRINKMVKFREGFRPFAPIVLEEHVDEFFDWDQGRSSPYMLFVTSVRENQRTGHTNLPAVTHVDGSARIQTVDARRHGLLYTLLRKFHRRTGSPVMLNTSLNLGWDPIVEKPRDAYETFMSSGIEVLCMGHFVLRKHRQSVTLNPDRAASIGIPLVSPCCETPLTQNAQRILCSRCKRAYEIELDIPLLFLADSDDDDVTSRVKSFYEDAPFPNYNDLDSVRSLIDRARQGGYAWALHRAIPYNTKVLEVGCGTGQLSNFLGVSCRQVIGTDICLNSLKLADRFRKEQGIAGARFLQMNLFHPIFEKDQFDVVLCNGVLHHTNNPRHGFERLVPLLRSGGYFVLGLYNKFGRLGTDFRRGLFRLTGGRGAWVDPVLREEGLSEGRRRAWFADQYQHPKESKHTIDEVLEWFEDNSLQYVNSVPALAPFGPRFDANDLFTPHDTGSRWDRLTAQMREIIAANREGGLFIMIGRKTGGDT